MGDSHTTAGGCVVPLRGGGKTAAWFARRQPHWEQAPACGAMPPEVQQKAEMCPAGARWHREPRLGLRAGAQGSCGSLKGCSGSLRGCCQELSTVQPTQPRQWCRWGAGIANRRVCVLVRRVHRRCGSPGLPRQPEGLLPVAEHGPTDPAAAVVPVGSWCPGVRGLAGVKTRRTAGGSPATPQQATARCP